MAEWSVGSALGRTVRLPRPSREAVAGAALLTALVVALFPAVVFRGEVFYERDLAFDWVTQVDVFVRSVAHGSWPLWDNSISFGQPLLADPSAQILYPPTWLHLLMRPFTYYALYAGAHVLLAGMGAAALARRLGASRRAALGAAALFMASGPVLSLVNLFHHLAGAAWAPWVARGALVTAETGRRRSALVWACVLAAQILAGSADMCAVGLILATVLVLPRLSLREPLAASNRRLVGLLALAVGLAVGLTAAQWLPTLEQARRSSRFNLGESMRTAWSVTPLGLLQVALPVPLWTVPLSPAAEARLTPWGEPFLRSLYVSLPALALAGAGLLRRGPGPHRMLALLGLAATLFALGSSTPFYALATTLAPPLRLFRYPSKAMPLVALCVAVLAGLGMDAWSGLSRRRHLGLVSLLATAVALSVLATFAVASGAASWMLPAGMPPGQASETLRPVVRQLAIGSGAGALALVLSVAARGGGLAALGGVAALILAGSGVNQTTRPAVLDLRPPVLDAVAPLPHGAAAHPWGLPRLHVFEYLRDPARSRRYLHRDDAYSIRVPPGSGLHEAQVLSQRLYPFPPVAGRWGFEGSYDVDFRALYPSYLAALSQLATRAEGTPLFAWLLRLGAVGHVVALHSEGLESLEPVAVAPTLFPDPARVFRVPRPLPRAYLVSGARPGGDVEALVRAASAMDPEREVLIADLDTPVPLDPGFTATVRRFRMRPDLVEAEVDASRAAWLVFVDAFDPGWRARVDGEPAELLRANVGFRAVRVPAGRHGVALAYRPTGVVAGLVVSGLAALTLAGLSLAGLAARRSADPETARPDAS